MAPPAPPAPVPMQIPAPRPAVAPATPPKPAATPAAPAAPATSQAATPADGEPAGPSKAAMKKEAKKAEKDAKKAEHRVAGPGGAAAGGPAAGSGPGDGPDLLSANYGDSALIQSQERTGRTWVDISALTAAHVGTRVLVRGRVHSSRSKGKSAFLVLRQRTATCQALMFVDDVAVSKGMVKYAAGLGKEAVVDVTAIVNRPEQPLTGVSQRDVELAVVSIHGVSTPPARLPFEIEDAARPEAVLDAPDCPFPRVGQDVRLDNRVIDLRTPANQAIFRVQGGVGLLFREFLHNRGFVEIHTPKLIAGSSEGGSAIFTLDYMGTPACLAQSPQLYKQMAICADFERVFEIGPVFRAENSSTNRHLCEFTGLDIEMTIHEHYFEVLDVLDAMFLHIFDGLNARYGPELAVIAEQFGAPPLQYLRPALRLDFKEGIAMLQAAGHEVDPLADLSTEVERALGKLVKDKYHTDFYVLYGYPAGARPFYTMPDPRDPLYTNSFDVFIRGEEIISGAQRVHDPEMLASAAAAKGIPLGGLAAYIDAFKYGAPPHGGFGVGLERVVMLFCDLKNIRRTSMFPRDPKRLNP